MHRGLQGCVQKLFFWSYTWDLPPTNYKTNVQLASKSGASVEPTRGEWGWKLDSQFSRLRLLFGQVHRIEDGGRSQTNYYTSSFSLA